MGYMIYEDLIIVYPEPYSLYSRGTVDLLRGSWLPCHPAYFLRNMDLKAECAAIRVARKNFLARCNGRNGNKYRTSAQIMENGGGSAYQDYT